MKNGLHSAFAKYFVYAQNDDPVSKGIQPFNLSFTEPKPELAGGQATATAITQVLGMYKSQGVGKFVGPWE